MNTRQIQRLFMLGLLSAGWIVTGMTAGCAGGSDDSDDLDIDPTPTPVVSPAAQQFAGTWSGPFTLNTGQTGLSEFVIGTDGAITGVAISTTQGSTLGDNEPVAGTIASNGNTVVQFRYNGSDFLGRGVLSLNAAGTELRGTLTRYINGVNTNNSVEVVLTRGPLPRS